MNTYQLTEDTLFERIRQHYLSDREISDTDDAIRKRWETAHSLMLDDVQCDKDVVKILEERFEISQAQAYRDLAAAKKLFGDLRKSTKESLRYLVTQWGIELYRMAKEAEDFKGMEKALDRITKANNLDKDDIDLPDPSKIQPPVQILSISLEFLDSRFAEMIDDKGREALNELRGQINQLIAKSPIRNYFDPATEDVEHEEVNE